MSSSPATPARSTSTGISAAHARVWACITCYETSASAVVGLVRALEPQVEQILLIDNSPGRSAGLETLVSSRTMHLPMLANLGTAGAMNVAWSLVVEAGADYMVSFDQDSAVTGDLVSGLLQAHLEATARGIRVAAIGPQKVDPRTGRRMRLLRPVHGIKRYAQADSASSVEVDHLITSGCLIARQAFVDIGPYLAAFFLDYVDIEWCVRARAKGYVLLCVPKVTMPHVIGDSVVRVGSRSVWVHSPARNRLLVRNHLLLWRVQTMPRVWLLNDIAHIAIKLVVQCGVGPRRVERIRQIVKGVGDGLRGDDMPPTFL